MKITSIFFIIACLQALSITITTKDIKDILIEYDQDGLPLPDSLKEILFDKYLDQKDQNLIFIEKLSQEDNNKTLYLVKLDHNPIFYITVSLENQINSTIDEILSLDQTIKKSDYDGSYPFFIPDNLPISILLENLFSYQDQDNKKRFIEFFLIDN